MPNISPGIAAKSILCVRVPASGSAFYQIDGSEDHNGPTFTKTEIVVTGHTSNAEEYITSPIYSAGTFDFALHFNPANKMHSFLMDNATTTASVENDWMLIFSNGIKYRFSGSMTEFAIKNGDLRSDSAKSTAKIRITGTVDRNVSFTNSGSLV